MLTLLCCVVRYLVLLRYGFWGLRAVMRVERAQDGSIRCSEVLDGRHSATWWRDGHFRATTVAGQELHLHRRPHPELTTPQVLYSIPGSRLIDPMVPPYDGDLGEGATVQMSAHAVLDQPHRVSLALVLVPTGEQPQHCESVGDRRIDQGVPDLWVQLTRTPDDPPGLVVAALRVLRWPPPLQAHEAPPYRPFDPWHG